MQQNSSGIGCFTLLSREEKHDFDHIKLGFSDQSKLDSCFDSHRYILCAMNIDKTAHELSYEIIEAVFCNFIDTNRHYFAVHTFIDQQITKMSAEKWMICKYNHGYYGQSDTSVSDIVELKERIKL